MSGDRGKVVAASVLVWTFLYFAGRVLLPFSATYGKWDNKRQYKAQGLVPSSVFLLGIVPVSMWALCADAKLEHTRVRGSTPVSYLIGAVATGYFIYDCAVVLYHFQQDGIAYLIHGVLCMVSTSSSLPASSFLPAPFDTVEVTLFAPPSPVSVSPCPPHGCVRTVCARGLLLSASSSTKW